MTDARYTPGGRMLSSHAAQAPSPLHEEALRHLRALEENPSDAGAWHRYAVALSDYHWRNREAADAVSTAIALDPFCAEYHFFRGYCHQKLCLLQEAAADLEMAWKLDASHQNAGYYLGQTYFYLGEYNRARETLRRLTRISPPDAEWAAISNWQYLTLRRLGLMDEARRASARITLNASPAVQTGTLGNTWTDCQYVLSCQAYNGLISPSEAIARAKPFGALNEWYVTTYMATLCDLDGRAQEAAQYYEKAVETFAGTEITKMRTMILPRLKALTGKEYQMDGGM